MHAVVTSLSGGVQSIAMNVSVCLSVCSHISGITRPSFAKFYVGLPMAAAWFSYGSVEIRFELPVLWMTSSFNKMGPAARHVYS